ncbi:site-specific integrase [Nemorincola caseinilytica]|uniref:Site-specific integrase n=1 Tax=Nemorincola caseinilytica TaxID=2054315 RepID=A0ABP8N4Z5_9BACT
MNYKFILDKRRIRQNNTYPLKVRVYEGTKSTERSLSIAIKESEWDDDAQVVLKTCKNHKLYNSKLAQERVELDKQVLFGIEATQTRKPKPKHSIIDYGSRLSVEYERTGKSGNSIVYNTAVEMLLRYTKQKNLTFEDIDYSFLVAFQNDLLTRGVGVNTISIYLRTIRAIFNKAINEELTDNYPFKKFRIKQQPTPSRSLTVEELRKIAHYKCSGVVEFNRDLFLLSFCLIGINFADLLTLTTGNIVNGRVTFARKKTHKVYSILLHSQAETLFAKWDKGTHYLLPVLSPTYKGVTLIHKTQLAISLCNHYLKKIAKDLEINKQVSTYYARYSWANIARSLGYSKDLIAEALGHEYGNKVTGIYLDNYENAVLDKANEQVIAAIFS